MSRGSELHKYLVCHVSKATVCFYTPTESTTMKELVLCNMKSCGT